MNQCWNIVNWTLRNKLQWNLNQNSSIFIQENLFEDVAWKMAVILSQPQCVDQSAYAGWTEEGISDLQKVMLYNAFCLKQCCNKFLQYNTIHIKHSNDNVGILGTYYTQKLSHIFPSWASYGLFFYEITDQAIIGLQHIYKTKQPYQ